MIEPYVLPVSPYEAFTSGQQNDVPLLIGSNAEEARAMVDVSHETAATFSSDLERSVGQLPPALVAAYPHATDEEARQAQLGLERDLRFGWDMWAWARLQAENRARALSSTIRFDSSRRSRPAQCTQGWGASHYAELWYVFDHLDQIAVELDHGRSEIGRGDVQLLGQLREVGQSKRPGPSPVACVRQCGEQGPISRRSDHRWRRGEYPWTERLRLRLLDGSWQVLCRTLTPSQFEFALDIIIGSSTNIEPPGATRSRLENIMKIEIVHCPT